MKQAARLSWQKFKEHELKGRRLIHSMAHLSNFLMKHCKERRLHRAGATSAFNCMSSVPHRLQRLTPPHFAGRCTESLVVSITCEG